jgi:hypothetical protein
VSEAQSLCGSEIVSCGNQGYAQGGCAASSGLGCGGCGCQQCVCTMDSFCCATAWDSLCATECDVNCGFLCYQGDCCTGNGTPGCVTPSCVNCVCAADSFCCSTSWDGLCANRANNECAGACPQCNVCGNGYCGPGEDCCDCDADCGGVCVFGSCIF